MVPGQRGRRAGQRRACPPGRLRRACFATAPRSLSPAAAAGPFINSAFPLQLIACEFRRQTRICSRGVWPASRRLARIGPQTLLRESLLVPVSFHGPAQRLARIPTAGPHRNVRPASRPPAQSSTRASRAAPPDRTSPGGGRAWGWGGGCGRQGGRAGGRAHGYGCSFERWGTRKWVGDREGGSG